MAHILWKGGKVPPDAAVVTGEIKSVAAYTGTAEEAESVVAEENQQVDPQEGNKSRSLDEILEGLNAKAAEVMRSGTNPRRVGPRPERSDPQPSSPTAATPTVNKPESTTLRGAAVRRSPMGGTVYNLARRRTEIGTGPIVVAAAGSSQLLARVAVMREAVVPRLTEEFVVDDQRDLEPQRAQIIPLRLPMTEEQRRADRFYRESGINMADVRAILEPGWTVAGMLDPRENARRLYIGIRNCGYDVEMMALKAKHAVHDFLHKKRPTKT